MCLTRSNCRRKREKWEAQERGYHLPAVDRCKQLEAMTCLIAAFGLCESPNPSDLLKQPSGLTMFRTIFNRKQFRTPGVALKDIVKLQPSVQPAILGRTTFQVAWHPGIVVMDILLAISAINTLPLMPAPKFKLWHEL